MMTPKNMWYLGLLIAGGCVIASCYVATHYAGWQYQGGRLLNNGLLSRPRFEAQFPSIALDAPGRYEYTFRRFPADDAVVMLATPSEPTVASIEQLATEISLRLTDQDGQVRCAGAGSPRGKAAERLIVTSAKGVIGLWHQKCARLELTSCNPCQLSISVGPVDPSTPRVMLVPTLQGGGWELP
jgi:hypothetical protein